MASAAMRWLRHHSALDGEKGDGVIVGASSLGHLDENLVGFVGSSSAGSTSSMSEEPLPESIVQAFHDAWTNMRVGSVASYYRGCHAY